MRSVAVRPAPWMQQDIQLPYVWSDTDDSCAANWMQQQGVIVPTSIAGEAIEVVVRRPEVPHPVREYLKSLSWDGKARLWSWLTTYLGADPSPYASAVGTAWMISAVRSDLRPWGQSGQLSNPRGATGHQEGLRRFGYLPNPGLRTRLLIWARRMRRYRPRAFG